MISLEQELRIFKVLKMSFLPIFILNYFVKDDVFSMIAFPFLILYSVFLLRQFMRDKKAGNDLKEYKTNSIAFLVLIVIGIMAYFFQDWIFPFLHDCFTSIQGLV